MAGVVASWNSFAVKAPLAALSSASRLGRLSAVALSFPVLDSFPMLTSGRRQRLLSSPAPFPTRAYENDGEWGEEGGVEGSEGAGVAVLEVAEPDETAELKRKLIDLLSGTDRGLKASSETTAEILELITDLEVKNPIPAPNDVLSLLNGKWILAYTSSSQLFPLLGSWRLPQLVKVDEISQTIDSESLTAVNSVKFAGPLSFTSLTTNAKFEVRSPKRVQIKFEEGIVGTPQLTDDIVIPDKVEFLGHNIDLSPFKGIINSLQGAASSVAKTISRQPPLRIPINNTNAESWLLTTYLDEELRISRGDGGDIFVLIKEGSPLLN
ncbi:chromoplast-specific carotenoid-associated protein C1, chromoplastic-like [Curcuma longa]|uniref:chromoplast-specific carotenoid-associated protein C1, chromoplastic-like n=1 Tax=Curcuma longa TaxID=136217 RepID=UPI003D9EF145